MAAIKLVTKDTDSLLPADVDAANLQPIRDAATEYTDESVDALGQEVAANFVASAGVSRIVASYDPDAEIEPGDLLLVYDIPKFFHDFSDLDEFAVQIGNAWTLESEVSGATGDYAAESPSGVSGRRFLAWTEIGEQADVEVVTRVRLGSPTGSSLAGGVVVRGAGESHETAHGIYAAPRVDGGEDQFYVGRWVAGSSSGPASIVAFEWEPGDWVRVRVRVEGGVARFKVWHDGDPEPDDWTIPSFDVGAITGPGLVGVYAGSAGHYFDWVGVALEGGTAPMEPLA